MKKLAIFLSGLAMTSAAAETDFKQDVFPILEAHCFKCHGPDKQESDLRLDSRAGMLTGGDFGPAIVPGDAAKSYLIKAITTDNVELRMPPKGKRLSPEQVATLNNWIAKGAVWPGQKEAVARNHNRTSDHWSFQSLPTEFAHDSIDGFIHAKLDKTGLRSSPEANRHALIRRVTLDLTGLPPTPEEVDAFLADKSENAWRKAVDRLLKSPAYGDRWAQHWLDVIRYADSRGYEFNSLRGDTWPYRDWVIAAFNGDLAWDEFLFQQVAGDTIGIDPATGFLVTAPLPTPPEVGREAAQIRQARFNALDEIVQNVGASMLGLTVGCARCHDHKFDPISARDYYRVVSVFSGVQFNRRLWRSKDAERKKKVAALDTKLSEIEAELRKFPGPRIVERGRYTDFFNAVDARWVRLNIDKTDAKGDGPVFDEIEIYSAGKDVNVALASLGAIASSSGVAKHLGGRDDMLNDGKFGSGSIWTADRIPPAWVQIQLPELTRINRLSWSRDRDLAVSDSAKHAVRLTSAWRIEVAVAEGKWQPVVPRFRGSPPTEAQRQRQHELEARRDQLQQQLNAMSAPLEVFAGRFVNPEPIHLLMRGDPGRPRDRVGPGALQILKGFELTPGTASESERRAAFAKWLTKEAAHLTARVAVNRIWQHHFGAGLVDTPNDFGVMGSRPTHPELLDWLAAEFIASGWKVKSIQRRILASATYRQSSSSRGQSEAMRADADTRLLWRFPPRRLDAETIRDSMLKISGNLDPKRGGEGVNIFTRQGSFDQWKPLADPPTGSNRRMIYLTRIRGVDDGMFKTFDLPECGQVKDKRTESTTPLQALNLLNGKFTLKQSAALAKRIEDEAGGNSSAQVTRAFERILGRPPEDAELVLCQAAVRAEGLETVCRALFNSNEFLFLP
ncbi:MAG: PSD1 and planctomycete cytochrome C domain-containing protein [Cognatishimia sp.]|nr:PSD1 and planctomycete cytochrome C domain-containing protein [Cognatishimia sp.]